jgi:hypothetical protein
MSASVPLHSLGWFWKGEIKQGQVVLIQNPLDDSGHRLLRVMATAGQRIAADNVGFIIDGKRLRLTDMGINEDGSRLFKESLWGDELNDTWLITVPDKAIHWTMPELMVEEGTVFLACDNRAACLDSRWWGPVSTQLINGSLRMLMTKPNKFHTLVET